MLIFDLDNLGRINDGFGHEAGDTLLRTTGTRLRRLLREEDVLGRLGGDQFGVLTTGHSDTDAVEAIVRMVIGIAKELELKVIAEGVETAGQRDFLHQHRCNQIQGFYLSRPVPAESIPGTFAAFPPTQS